ncbi:MAG TPA: TonB family protein [Steroidobacteraceae bacterium]|nr:TonB family protein [Steroidobacteraceae bacterium]
MTSENKFDWIEGLSRSLLHHAARRVPKELSDRLREEWLADMSERPQGLSRLRFALGCHWATSIIAREHSRAAVPAVSAAVAPGNFGGYLQMGPVYSPRRTVTFILVASLHAAVFAGLMLGLAVNYNKPAPTKFQSFVIDKPRPRIDPPPLAKPNIENPVIDARRPRDVVIEADPPVIPVEPEGKSAGTFSRPIVPPQGPAPLAVNRVQGAPGIDFPNASEFYPDIDIRRGREGNVAVTACVDAKGRLTSSPSILQSSGSASLDQAALRLAKAGSGHYRPTKEDGRPVESCYGFLIQFILK